MFGDLVGEKIVNVLLRYGISEIYYGHIHGKYNIPSVTEYKGIKMRIISSDYLDFTPIPVEI